jgi:hypothetical protein
MRRFYAIVVRQNCRSRDGRIMELAQRSPLPLRRQAEPAEPRHVSISHKLIGVDRIRQQPNGRREYGEHWSSSMTPPACASA